MKNYPGVNLLFVSNILVSNILMSNISNFKDELFQHGVATTCLISSPETTNMYNEWINDSLQRMSGYTTLAHREKYYVLGSFGALGNPESFHLDPIRSLRLKAIKFITNLYSGTNTYIQQLPDRFSIRRPGAAIPSETAHRDITPGLMTNQCVYGGFINLDSVESQWFSCVPGSQIDRSPGHISGQLENPDVKVTGFVRTENRKRMSRIEVKPGHMILFRQDILHEIARVKYVDYSYRLYIGYTSVPYSVCEDLPPTMHPESVNDFVLGLSPCLPSGQKAPIYSSNHMSCLVKKITVPWCRDYLVNDMLYQTGKGHMVCPRYWYTPEQLLLEQTTRSKIYEDDEFEALCLHPRLF